MFSCWKKKEIVFFFVLFHFVLTPLFSHAAQRETKDIFPLFLFSSLFRISFYFPSVRFAHVLLFPMFRNYLWRLLLFNVCVYVCLSVVIFNDYFGILWFSISWMDRPVLFVMLFCLSDFLSLFTFDCAHTIWPRWS